jgi:hypothetical protein
MLRTGRRVGQGELRSGRAMKYFSSSPDPRRLSDCIHVANDDEDFMQMNWRTLAAPIWNNPRIWRRGSAIAACFFALACGSSSSTSTDTRTNWLASCSDDCGGGLTCLCGVCTETCGQDEACSDLGSGAVCVEAPAGCGQSKNLCAREDFDFPPNTDASASSAGDTSTSTFSESATSTAGETATTSVDEPSSNEDTTVSSSSGDSTVSTVTSTATSDVLETGGDAGADPCDIPGRQYTSRDPDACTVEPECGIIAEGFGNVAFSDECGCGCEPYVPPERTDTLLEGQCAEAPSSGFPVDATVLAESEVSAIPCETAVSAIVRSAAQLEQWATATGCDALVDTAAAVDFSTQALIIVGTSERPAASVTYVVQTLDGVIHVGIDTRAYCLGVPPTDGFALLTVPTSPSAAVIANVETCYETCDFDGGLPPP